MADLLMCGDKEHRPGSQDRVLAGTVFMVHLPVEHVGKDLFCEVRMQTNLHASRCHCFRDAIEREERTLFGRRHEEIGAGVGKIGMTGYDVQSSVRTCFRHEFPSRSVFALPRYPLGRLVLFGWAPSRALRRNYP